jgi:hypothetical protein
MPCRSSVYLSIWLCYCHQFLSIRILSSITIVKAQEWPIKPTNAARACQSLGSNLLPGRMVRRSWGRTSLSWFAGTSYDDISYDPECGSRLNIAQLALLRFHIYRKCYQFRYQALYSTKVDLFNSLKLDPNLPTAMLAARECHHEEISK